MTQLENLAASINKTRQIYFTLKNTAAASLDVENVDFADYKVYQEKENEFSAITVQEAAAAYFRFINLKEHQKLDGGGANAPSREIQLS